MSGSSISSSSGSARSPERRAKRLGLLLVAAAAACLAAIIALILAWSTAPRSAARPPASAVFANPRLVQELLAVAAEQPRDPEWQLRLGHALLEEGHYLSALNAFQSALGLDPKNKLARRGMALCYRSVDRYEKALGVWKELAKEEPSSLNLRLEQVQELHRLDRKPEAEAELDAASRLFQEGQLSVEGGPAVAWEQLAAAYAGLGNLDRGAILAERALATDPKRLGALVVAGRAALSRKQPQRALEYLRKARLLSPQEPNAALFYLAALRAADPVGNEGEIRSLLEQWRDARLASGGDLFELATLYERKQLWEKAATTFVAAEQKSTRTQEALRRAYKAYLKAGMREDGIYTEGRYYQSQGKISEAIACYRRLIAMHKQCPSGYMHVARAQLLQGDWKAALASLEAARRDGGYRSSLYAVFAEAYGRAGDVASEMKMWRKFIDIDPENADIGYQHLGTLASNDGKLDTAEQHYRKCVELRPDADLYRVRLAELLMQRRAEPGRLDEAIRHLEAGIKVGRNYAAAHYLLGVAYRYADRKQEAVWALRHAIDLDPGDGKPYLPLGQVLNQTGKREEGAEMLALARRYNEFHQAYETLRARVDRNPRDVAARRSLAFFYERTGADVNAVREYEQILLLTPGDEQARHQLSFLNRQRGGIGSGEWDPLGS